MPTPTKYTYSIQNDFPNHKVSSDRLTIEIQLSSISVALDRIDTAGDECDIWFKDVLPGADQTTLNATVAAHSGLPMPALPQSVQLVESDGTPLPRTPDGRLRTTGEKPNTSRVTIISHDWCDPTTWYTKSTYVADEPTTDTGDHTVYQLQHPNIIDSYHGKISQEDYLKDGSGRSYRVVVKVNGVTKVEQDPHFGTGGDFTIDYALGKIHFTAPLDPADVVTATYHYAGDSTFTVAALPGKLLSIDMAEIQFSTDVEILDTVSFQPYGLVEAFAPAMMNPPYNIPAGTKIPLGNPIIYKGIRDFANDSVRTYPTFPAIGTNWRGLTQPMVVFDWDYVSATMLDGTKGMEIRIKLQHDKPFSGTFGTTTFYCLVDVP
jgi:hypothetical protein